jgi:HAMP domain-containing protein
MSLSGIGIKARLYSGFGALVFACAGIASFATYQQSAIQGQVTKLGLIGENTARVLQISVDLQALRRANLRYMYDADEASYIEAGEREASATRLLGEAAKTTASEERRKTYSEVEANVGQLHAKRDELGVTVKNFTTGKALLLSVGDRLAAEAAKLVETYRTSSRDPVIMQAAEDLETSLLQVQIADWRFFATRDAAGIARFKSSLDQARLRAEKLQKYILSEAVSTALDSINSQLLSLGTAFDATSSSVLRSDEIWSKELRAIAARNTTALATAETALKQDFAAIKERTDEMVASTALLQEIIAGLSLVLGGILAFFVARAILRPVQGMTEAMTKLAGGDLRIEVPALENKDEIGGMAKAVVVFQKAAIEKLRLEQEAIVERERNEVAQRRAQEEAIAGERELVSNSIGAGLAKLAAKEVTFRLTDALPEAYRSLQSDFNNALEPD